MDKHTRNQKRESGEVRAPFWARAHRDWRFIAVVVLMLAAIAAYLITGDLAWRFHSQPIPSSGSSVK